jgi:oligosaccharide repeat unit polymerase
MIEAIGSPWPAYAVLVIVTVFSRLRCGSWFAPAAFVGLVWSFFTGVSLALVDYQVPGIGIWMLVLLIVAIQLGALIAHELQPQAQLSFGIDCNELDSLIAPCRRYGLLCAVVALAGCVYFLFMSLEEFGLPFTWLGVLEVGAKWTLLRYTDVVEPWSVRMLVTWFHPATLLGGFLFACSKKRLDRIAGVATLLPAVAYGAFTGARAAILLGLTCWIGACVSVMCVRNQDHLALFSGKRVALLLFVSACMVGMFGGIDIVRDSTWQQDAVFDVQGQKLVNYMFGSPAAFAEWYAHTSVSGAQWGAYTFAGEFDLLHLKTRIVGTYLEKSNVVGTESTNVYTIFRGFIEDFSAFGAALVAAGIGGLVGWMYSTRSKNVRTTLFWLSMFYSVLLFSPLVSLFSFNGAALAWVAGWFVLVRTARWNPHRHHQPHKGLTT